MTSSRPPTPPPEGERTPDPRFDLAQGVKIAAIVVTIMVVITLVCVYLG
jgi:hypothetical protein